LTESLPFTYDSQPPSLLPDLPHPTSNPTSPSPPPRPSPLPAPLAAHRIGTPSLRFPPPPTSPLPLTSTRHMTPTPPDARIRYLTQNLPSLPCHHRSRLPIASAPSHSSQSRALTTRLFTAWTLGWTVGLATRVSREGDGAIERVAPSSSYVYHFFVQSRPLLHRYYLGHSTIRPILLLHIHVCWLFFLDISPLPKHTCIFVLASFLSDPTRSLLFLHHTISHPHVYR
jgi:hypothetical protein